MIRILFEIILVLFTGWMLYATFTGKLFEIVQGLQKKKAAPPDPSDRWTPKSPHEKYPELWQWKEGDRIHGHIQTGVSQKLDVIYIGVTEDGIILWERGGDKGETPIDLFMTWNGQSAPAINIRLKNEAFNKKAKEAKEYNQIYEQTRAEMEYNSLVEKSLRNQID